MPRTARNLRCNSRNRRGAIAALVALTLPFLLILGCFALNIAYVQQVREELRIACDSAAKAALVNYGATESTASAIALGQTVSNSNLVGGKTLSLTSGNFSFGNAAKNGSGTYIFTAGGTPTNSVQVSGTASRPYWLAAFLPSTTFSTSQTSTTTRVSHDICLVLDRSASMAFDLSGSEFVYPNVSPYNTNALIQNYFSPPAPTLSRWAALTSAVSSFISVLQARNLDVRVSLATYSETFSLGNYSATESSLDVPLTSTYSSITTAMNNYGSKPLLGDTYTWMGMVQGASELAQSARSRTTADRTIILMTDGVATVNGPITLPATSLYFTQNYGIVTHVITFSAEAVVGSNGTTMQQTATNGNGLYFYAPNAAQLTTAFTTIADSLPAVLIK